ncbi:MAG: hypothetical protein ACOX5Z_10330 [Desulfobulbus sp.]|jgi:hypothetical protein
MTAAKPIKRRSRQVLTESLINQIVELVSAGVDPKAACAACGIVEVTYSDWMKQAEQGRRALYRQFKERVWLAEQLHKARLVQTLTGLALGGQVLETTVTRFDGSGRVTSEVVTEAVSQPDLTALRWILESKYPDEFGPKSQQPPQIKDLLGAEVSLFGRVTLPGSAALPPGSEIEPETALEE